ncbi:DUF4302 domain-containing protein [Pararcticibacter amylolyticus]|uniref:DUF4302 domain-containing protein n=1 Tax=Pararcticibacter amylolyticus TaxID=2173175 RepID=A0A2U2PFQ1_9SPHI|nr:DUF4302 domain-containing protein [Pararcticibacter amylolyticus]PWG80238.1 hypothetical protein DDR33_13685 [Pararcticibacter amylolyticus]
MKKALLFLLIVPFILISCNKDDDLEYSIEKSFKDPLEKLAELQEATGASADGWKAILKLKDGGFYSLFLKLNPAGGKLSLYADINETTASVPSESGYKFEITQGINATLSLEEGSHLDLIQFEDPSKGSDRQYSFLYSNGDTIRLQGNRFGDELTLVKASAAERQQYEGKSLEASMKSISEFLSSSRFLQLQPDPSSALQLSVNEGTRTLVATYVNAKKKAENVGSEFSYTLNGIRFRNALKVGNILIDEFIWDEQKKAFFFSTGGSRTEVNDAALPIIPLHYLLGNEFPSVISVPSPTRYASIPGWSTAFSGLWATSDAAMIGSPYRLILYFADFSMNIPAGTMNLDIYFVSNNSLYTARFPYKFSKTDDGVFKFAAQPLGTTGSGANANLIKGYVKSITDVVSLDRFKIDYYEAPELGGLLGQFTSVDRPGIYFTGTFGSLAE